MNKVSTNAVLVLIDVQKGFNESMWGERNNPDAETVMARVLNDFRRHGRRIIHVRHDSKNPDSLLRKGKPTFESKDEVKPLEGELVITKHANNAFIGTELERELRAVENPEVYFMGLTTEHCVSTTARMSGDLGFKTFVIYDGCAAHEHEALNGEKIPAEVIHRVNLASISGEL